MSDHLKTKKALILDTAREIKVQQWTPAEIDQLRRRLLAEHGDAGKADSDYIADVLKDAGQKVTLNQQEEAEEQYEEEFEDLLHFKTLEDAEVSIMRLDELMRKFRVHGEHAAVERVLNIARLGKRVGRFSHTRLRRRQTPRGNDRAQPQGGGSEARGKRRDWRVVPRLAGNAGCFLRLAGGPEAVAGLPCEVSIVGVR